jgi:DNA-directed RNA polymerase subunit alpha
MLAREGLYPEAIDELETARLADESCRETTFLLAYVLDLVGEDRRALELYQLCTSNPPVHVNALVNLATIYEDRGEFDEAEKCLRQVLDVEPNHARARLFLKDVLSSTTMYYDEDQERVLEKRNAILDTPISDFELSVRSRNCLKKMDIETLGDLLRISEPELLAYKNFGETSLTEIKNMLTQKGLRLGQMKDQPGMQPTADSLASCRLSGPLEILNHPVSELELSVRARKCLQRLGITTLGELCARTEAELLGTKNFGQTSLNDIKQRLAEHGLSLRRLED